MLNILNRNENGKLKINTLDLQIFFGDLFEICNSEEEINFVLNNIIECAECIADEIMEEKDLI